MTAPRARHNPRPCRTPLPLSVVGAGGRLSEVAARHVALGGGRRRARYPAELIARAIANAAGDVWPAVLRFGVSYEHALRIRNGWRPDGERAAPIEYAYSRNVGRRARAR